MKADQFSTKRIKRSTTDSMSSLPKMSAASNQKQFEEIENNKSRKCAGILTDNGSTLNAINNELLDFRVDVHHTSSDQHQHSSTMSTTQKTPRTKSKMNNQNHYRRSHSHKSKNRYTHHNNTEQQSQHHQQQQHQPHDKLDHCQRKSTSSTSSTSSGGGGGINVISNPLEAAVCTQPRTTIVVQQVSKAF